MLILRGVVVGCFFLINSAQTYEVITVMDIK